MLKIMTLDGEIGNERVCHCRKISWSAFAFFDYYSSQPKLVN